MLTCPVGLYILTLPCTDQAACGDAIQRARSWHVMTADWINDSNPNSLLAVDFARELLEELKTSACVQLDRLRSTSALHL